MTNNRFIEEKRESLTRFIREQMIGPGVYGYKFGMDGESNDVEILDVTPGSIYCSGILFPKKKKGDDVSDGIPSEDNLEVGIESVVSAEDTDENESSLYDEEDIKQLTQRYPDSFGISCCLGKNVLTNKDFIINLSGRFYSKIHHANLPSVFVKIDDEDLMGVLALLRDVIHVPGLLML